MSAMDRAAQRAADKSAASGRRKVGEVHDCFHCRPRVGRLLDEIDRLKDESERRQGMVTQVLTACARMREQIQDTCMEAGVASDLRLAVQIICERYKAAEERLEEIRQDAMEMRDRD
jgi:hypothetical protein